MALLTLIKSLPFELWQQHLFPELHDFPVSVVALGLTCKQLKLTMTCLVTGKPASYFQWHGNGKKPPNARIRKARRSVFPGRYLRCFNVYYGKQHISNYIYNAANSEYLQNRSDVNIMACGSLSQLQWLRAWRWFPPTTSLLCDGPTNNGNLSLGCSRAPDALLWLKAFLPAPYVLNETFLTWLQTTNVLSLVILPHGLTEFFDTDKAKTWLVEECVDFKHGIYGNRMLLSIDPFIPNWTMPMDNLFKCLLFVKHCTVAYTAEEVHHMARDMLRRSLINRNPEDERCIQLGTWLVAQHWLEEEEWTIMVNQGMKREQSLRPYKHASPYELLLLSDPINGPAAMECMQTALY